MNRIYSVTINFEDWESSCFETIGHFDTLEAAESVREKWEAFFDEYCGNMPSGDSETDLDYYDAYGKYQEIKDYVGIEIKEHIVGIDFFSKNERRTKEMHALVMQWERDYIIDKITKQK